VRTAGRALAFAFSLVVVAGTLVAVTTAAGGTVSAAKPLIGKPVGAPVQPQAGKLFSVSFKVTRGGAPLTAGAMTLIPTIDGKTIAHTGLFKGGVARGKLVVPSNAGGKVLKVKVTIRVGGSSATKTASFHVRGAALPTVSIADASTIEGNSGTSTLAFPVTLSSAGDQTVSIHYATSDGSAASPSDYAAASGTLTFAPGALTKYVSVSVVGDTNIEQDESFTMTLSSPTNAKLGKATAAGTITNDDTAPVYTVGSYKGATQEGNFVFLTVQSDGSVSGFRANNISENCTPNSIYLSGSVSWGTSTFPIESDGTFIAQGQWSGSDVVGDAEYTAESWKVTGTFSNATSISGSITLGDDLNYKGSHFSCTSTVTYTAALGS